MIVGNQMNNLHTLVLLDLDPTGMGVDAPIPMSPKQAFSTVMEMAGRLDDKEGDFFDSLESRIPEWDCILLSDIGTADQRLVSGSFSEISDVAGGRIHCLIFPPHLAGWSEMPLSTIKRIPDLVGSTRRGQRSGENGQTTC